MCARAWDHLAGNGGDRVVFLLFPLAKDSRRSFMAEPCWFFSFLFSFSLAFFVLAIDDDTRSLSSSCSNVARYTARCSPSVPFLSHPRLASFFPPLLVCLPPSSSSAARPPLSCPARLPSVSLSDHSSHLHLPPPPHHFPIRTPTGPRHPHPLRPSPASSIGAVSRELRAGGVLSTGRCGWVLPLCVSVSVCVWFCRGWVLRPSHGWRKAQRFFFLSRLPFASPSSRRCEDMYMYRHRQGTATGAAWGAASQARHPIRRRAACLYHYAIQRAHDKHGMSKQADGEYRYGGEESARADDGQAR